MGSVLVYLSLRTVLELAMVCLYLCTFHFVRYCSLLLGVYWSVTPYANVFCDGVFIGVSVTLYAKCSW